MTDRYQAIYARHAEQYQRLIEAEDCDGHILPALIDRVPLAGARAIDIGAGTGRVSRLLLDGGIERVVATDRAPAMLEVARKILEQTAPGAEGTRWDVRGADVRELPFDDDSFDIATAGWAFGHLTQWESDAWQVHVDAAVNEMDRVVRPGGCRIIFETLGTGVRRAGPPSEALARYYRHLEVAHGFDRTVLETDYLFSDAEQAADICGFFFGESMAKTIVDQGWSRVPEWTGMWVKIG